MDEGVPVFVQSQFFNPMPMGRSSSPPPALPAILSLLFPKKCKAEHFDQGSLSQNQQMNSTRTVIQNNIYESASRVSNLFKQCAIAEALDR
jgi:hypothetical protein